MKKTFTLTHPKIKLARLFDTAKNDIKKYIKRERNKTLPKGSDYWDFDCKFGQNEEQAKVIHVAEINKCINEVEALEQNQFYIEVIAKPAIRTARPKQAINDDADLEDDNEY